MKKVILMFAIIATMFSCKESSKSVSDSDSTTIDSVKVDSIVTDSIIIIDSISKDTIAIVK